MPLSYLGSTPAILHLLFGPPQHDHHMIAFRWNRFMRDVYGIKR